MPSARRNCCERGVQKGARRYRQLWLRGLLGVAGLALAVGGVCCLGGCGMRYTSCTLVTL